MYVNRVEDINGVYVVLVFIGFGVLYWDMYVRGLILGFIRGVKKEYIVRVILELIVY